MDRLLKFALSVAIIAIVECENHSCKDYPDFRYMTRRTDYSLVGNLTNSDQFIVKGDFYFILILICIGTFIHYGIRCK